MCICVYIHIVRIYTHVYSIYLLQIPELFNNLSFILAVILQRQKNTLCLDFVSVCTPEDTLSSVSVCVYVCVQ